MYLPKFELLSFDILPWQRKLAVLRAMLEALVIANWQYLEMNPNTPALYAMAPRYVFKTRPFGLDAWQDIPQTINLRSGDCKDFACWRVAELRKAGYDDVTPYVLHQTYKDPTGQGPDINVFHIQVRIHDRIEDPSAILGMPMGATYEQLAKGQGL